MNNAPPTPATPDAWLLYDGGCGICRSAVPRWAGMLARAGIGVAPLQEPWVLERLGMSEEEALRDVRLISGDGRQFAGADVYREVMRRIWWARPLSWLASAPGIAGLFDALYRRIAANRHQLSEACSLPNKPKG